MRLGQKCLCVTGISLPYSLEARATLYITSNPCRTSDSRMAYEHRPLAISAHVRGTVGTKKIACLCEKSWFQTSYRGEEDGQKRVYMI